MEKCFKDKMCHSIHDIILQYKTVNVAIVGDNVFRQDI